MFCVALGVLLCGCAGSGRGYVDADAEFGNATFLRSAGKHADAARAFAGFARRFEHDNRADLAQYLSGEEYSVEGNYDAALDSFNALFRRFPHSAYLGRANDLCLRLGLALLADGNEKGVTFLERVVQRAPYGDAAATAHMELGRYYYQKGRFSDASFEFDTVVRERPDSALATRAELGAALAEFRLMGRPLKNAEHAFSARERLLRLRNSQLEASDMETVDRYLRMVADALAEKEMLSARFYLKQGEVVSALAHLREVVENYPGSRYHKAAADLILFIDEEARSMKEPARTAEPGGTGAEQGVKRTVGEESR